jgi:hypothetical protein
MRSLMRKEIQKLNKPVLETLTRFHEEMQKAICDCAFKEVTQFPKLRTEIINVASGLLNQTMKSTKLMVDMFLKTQLIYVSAVHKDYQEQVNAVLKKIDTLQLGFDKNMIRHEDNDKYGSHAILERKSLSEESLAAEGKKKTKKWFGSKKKKASSISEISTIQEEPVCKESVYLEEDVNEKSRTALDEIRNTIQAYVEITRDSIQDFVPKSIVNSVIYEMNSNIGVELVMQYNLFIEYFFNRNSLILQMVHLFKPEKIESLIEMSEHDILKQNRAVEMLEV